MAEKHGIGKRSLNNFDCFHYVYTKVADVTLLTLDQKLRETDIKGVAVMIEDCSGTMGFSIALSNKKRDKNMQQVFYPGHAGEPCVGEYAIVLDRTDMIARADIVLVSRLSHMASFHSSGFGRDIVLNRILANDLQGVRLNWIRLFLLTEQSASASAPIPYFHATEITRIKLDTDDFIARGNPCTIRRRNFLSRLFTGISQEVSYWNGDVVGGCARFSTSLENLRLLDQTEIETFCTRIGLRTPAAKPSPASIKTGSLPAAHNTWSSSSYH
ncbi:hypothetical protein [Mesorhizobium sp. L-2-11]|uniref:hypothetical protein n=1 Tax=Mesorhizobium sp. L-2-11 TaxID=2744521 RepID=UPI0018EE0FF8|nr:hypothetical protein [Mesorhizobium sp. L-2-11]BCH19880.1 hypothetical protein MesoLjLa_67310 [Mesorhizobium sp. L-2-11]